MRRRTVGVAGAGLAAVVLGAGATAYAGGDGTASTAATKATTLRLTAGPGSAIKYNKKSLRARPGKVTIRFRNRSTSVPHNVEVEGRGVEKETRIITNSRATLRLNLKKGTYTFYCGVGQHRQAGMEGKLRVR
jgi:plastocyanin